MTILETTNVEKTEDETKVDVVTLNDMSNEDIGAHIKALSVRCVINKTKDREEFKTNIDGNLGDYPMITIDELLSYGFRRKINDPYGSSKFDAATKRDLCLALNEAFKLGKIKKAKSGGAGVDDIVTVQRGMARAAIRVLYSAHKTKDYKDDFLSLDNEAQTAKIDKFIVKHSPKYETMAQAKIDEKKALLESDESDDFFDDDE